MRIAGRSRGGRRRTNAPPTPTDGAMADREADGRERAAPAVSLRDRRGRWGPGVSGNPAGRPPVLGPVRALAQRYSTVAVQQLAGIMDNPAASPALRLAAARVVLGWAMGGGRAVVVDDLARLPDDALELRWGDLVRAAAAVVAAG